MSLQYQSVEKYNNGRIKINFIYSRNLFEKLFCKPPRKISYVGSCTVWHEFPSGKRAGTLTESWLSDFEMRLEFENKHPLKNNL
jgi:hypothetical protein